MVQPGAPGQPTRTLPSSTRATLPPTSPADVQFMQHMIMHHAQAVEMTALIESHTENKELRTLGARISRSQVRRNEVYEAVAGGQGKPTSMTASKEHRGIGSRMGMKCRAWTCRAITCSCPGCLLQSRWTR